jgi:death-on-curing protein
MRYLTADQILQIHERVVTCTGGLPGVRVQEAVSNLATGLRLNSNRNELFSNVFSKAGVLMSRLMTDRPFHDGNRRTGIVAGVAFLRLNDRDLVASDEEILELCRRMEAGEISTNEVGEWLREHATLARGSVGQTPAGAPGGR